MSRPNRAKREQEMLQEVLHASSPEINPELMVALPDGSIISQQEESNFKSTFSLLVGLGDTRAKHREQVHMDATAILRAVCTHIRAIPPHLAEKSQQYGLSSDGVEFSQAALNYGRFCLSNTQDGIRFHTVTTTVAPEKFQKKADATTR